MDLEKFYGMAPKPRAVNRSIEKPADAKVMVVNESDFKQRILFTTVDDGPVSLSTPELKASKTMSVENFDEMIEQIFDQV